LGFGAAMIVLSAAAPLSAQGRFGDEESRLLREAAALESSRNLDGAERTLRRLLDLDPVSTGGIYAYERVLRQKGDLSKLLPYVDDYLNRREDSGIRSLKLQLLVEADSLDALVEESEAWIARSPEDETPYAEVARAYQEAFGHERAREVLESGRRRLGEDALALAIGDHYASEGNMDSAVDEWVRAISPDGSEVAAVRRRIQSLPGGGADAGRRLVAALARSTDTPRRRLGVRMALELGLAPEALELAQREVESLSGAERAAYLQELSAGATAGGVASVASWAFTELSLQEDDPGSRRTIDRQRAEASLAAGDTVGALSALDGVARTMRRGTTARRQIEARALLIAAEARRMDRLRTSWPAFREAYPDAPELDELAATTAATLVAAGDIEGAVGALEGIDGPRSSLERAYLLLGSGQLDQGGQMLMDAAYRLPPTEATDVIQMALLLARVSGDARQMLANAALQAHLGRGASAARTLADAAFDASPAERPQLLAEAARMADRAGDPDGAADIREQLVEEHPAASEAGEAAIALARYLAGDEGGVDEAVRILEDLITSQPEAAVVPEARLELERLRSREQ
jgi:tetratricopeptide (TPR) repeat protein